MPSASGTTIVEKRLYSAELERIREEFLATGNAAAATVALAARTQLVDGFVSDAYAATLSPYQGVALLSVGGYGRRELFPYSDVDLLFLAAEENRKKLKEPLSVLLQSLWDAGMRVSQSVRSVEECAELHEHNIELNISLLDQSFLAGDSGEYARFRAQLAKFIPAQRDDLNRHLSRVTRERQNKFQDTQYHLEPNIKEAPGGLRDYQVVCWANQLAGKERDAHELADCARRLFALRCHLHYLSGRDNNVLTFELQERIAEHLATDAARLMREYFREAGTMRRACLRVLDGLEAKRSPLFAQFRDRLSRLSNSDFTVSHDRVFFRTPALAASDPSLMLRLFAFMARHGIELASDTERRIAANLPGFERYFEQPRAIWPLLHEILSLPNSDRALRAMQETCVLRAIFPEAREIECLVIRDFYHRYTVDEHTLVAIQTVARLRGQRGNAFADLAAELEDLGLLLIALLFHDVGKGSPDEGHVDASVRVAGPALRRVGMPEETWRTVEFLIAAHLEMSSVMNSRDLSDPATAEYLAQRVGTVERLKLLTLLTYADISAVNPAAMTPWRSGLLWQLYTAAYRELTRELDTRRIQASAEEPAERRAFLEGLPTRYLRTHSPGEIDEHVRMERESEAAGVAIGLKKIESIYTLTVVSKDRPFLFASVAGAISSFGVNILKAEAFSNSRGTVLDVFTFADPLRNLDLNPSELDRLRSVAGKAVLNRVDVPRLLKSRPKFVAPSKRDRLEPRVSVDGQTSETATLIQIVAEDRPGLLYDLASAISSAGCSIEVVLIDTESHKAIDVFYVTAEGRKLEARQADELGERLLAVCGI
ncbi:MAG: HD domain-containing protein [Bryobacteraceae bacterium]